MLLWPRARTAAGAEDCRRLSPPPWPLQVRYTVLPNERFVELQAEPSVPRAMLAEAALARVVAMGAGGRGPPPVGGDESAAAAAAAAAGASPISRQGSWTSDPAAGTEEEEEQQRGTAVAAVAAAPLVPAAPLYRPTYCCELQFGLPGSLPYIDLPTSAIWEELAECIKIQVGLKCV